MAFIKFPSPKRIIVCAIFALIVVGKILHFYHNPKDIKLANDPVLTAQRQEHILHGDTTGGGHLHGTDAPCKSEFPPDWHADKVLNTITGIAANDNAKWKQQPRNGYHVTESMVDGVKVRVVVDDDKSHIITAYPINMPRNPCPDHKAANDN